MHGRAWLHRAELTIGVDMRVTYRRRLWLFLTLFTGSLSACASVEQVLNSAPMLDQPYKGNYQEAAACTLHELQTLKQFLSPNFQYFPFPSLGYIDIHATVYDAYTGPLMAFAIRFEDIDGSLFRASVRAASKGEGNEAIDALNKCADPA